MNARASKWLLHIFLGLLLLSIQSCSKDELTKAVGFIEREGSFAIGECEWVIVIGFDKFKPTNLPDNFKTDNLPVEVTYRLVRTSVDCPRPEEYSGTIHLNRIREIL